MIYATQPISLYCYKADRRASQTAWYVHLWSVDGAIVRPHGHHVYHAEADARAFYDGHLKLPELTTFVVASELASDSEKLLAAARDRVTPWFVEG